MYRFEPSPPECDRVLLPITENQNLFHRQEGLTHRGLGGAWEVQRVGLHRGEASGERRFHWGGGL